MRWATFGSAFALALGIGVGLLAQRNANSEAPDSRVADIETPDARHVRFLLKEPWPDFLTFYGSATGAGYTRPVRFPGLDEEE